MNKKDITDLVATSLSTLAVLLQVLVVLVALLGIAALFSARARGALVALRDMFSGVELWIAFGIALAAMAGSLFFSEFSDFIPCRLCWMQRIAMYPLVIILLIGAIRRDRDAALYALAFPPIGIAIGAYHKYIEINPEAESCQATAPCSTKWIDEFGYVTIPVLAMSAFAAIFVLLLFARSNARAEARAEAEPEGEDSALGEPGALPLEGDE